MIVEGRVADWRPECTDVTNLVKLACLAHTHCRGGSRGRCPAHRFYLGSGAVTLSWLPLDLRATGNPNPLGKKAENIALHSQAFSALLLMETPCPVLAHSIHLILFPPGCFHIAWLGDACHLHWSGKSLRVNVFISGVQCRLRQQLTAGG